MLGTFAKLNALLQQTSKRIEAVDKSSQVSESLNLLLSHYIKCDAAV